MPQVRLFPTLVAAAVFLAACSSSPRPAAPAPEAAPAAAPAAAAAAPTTGPDLAGDWEIRLVSTSEGTLGSMLRLVSSGGTYAGMMQALGEGSRPAYVRRVVVAASRVTIVMEWEGEEARIDGVIRGPGLIEGSFVSRPLQGRITLRRR